MSSFYGAPAGDSREEQFKNHNRQSLRAPIRMMALCSSALADAVGAEPGLPQMVVVSGKAGLGKTYAVSHAVAVHDAIYVRALSSWTRKSMLEDLVEELAPALPKAKTIHNLLKQVIALLKEAPRPIVIDEMDYVVQARIVELIRDIHDGAEVAILMVGEENLPAKLREWERFHRRILRFVNAVPADLDDARMLARVHCDAVTVKDDLLKIFLEKTHGNTGRLCNNLAAARREAIADGVAEIDLDWWGDRPIVVGDHAGARR